MWQYRASGAPILGRLRHDLRNASLCSVADAHGPGGHIKSFMAATPHAVTAASQCKRCVLVINPASCGGRTERRWRQVSQKFKRALEAASYQVDEQCTTHAGHAVHLAKQAVVECADVVAAVGGDGTVHEVVQGLMESRFGISSSMAACNGGSPTGHVHEHRGPALAVVPMGTGNDFIRSFGWDASIDAAVVRIASGSARSIDVGCITMAALPTASSASATKSATSPVPDGETVPGAEPAAATCKHWFINIASAGASAAAVQLAPWYSRWFGPLAYTLASAYALLSWRNIPCEVAVDGGPWMSLGGLSLLALGNGSTFGHGMRIAPGADPCDGKLLAVAVTDAGMLDFVRHLGALKAGNHLSLNIVRSFPFQMLELRATSSRDNARLVLELDGTIAGCYPAVVGVLPGAISLLGA